MSLANYILVVIFFISASKVSETGAQDDVLCFNSNTCAAAGEFDEAMTIEECCSNNPDGLAFRRFMSELCVPCIVYGFFNVSVTQPERGQGYMVRVGYMKGAASGGNLIFDVMDTPGTAREGPGFDYTVNTNFIRVIASAPDRIENVVYILRTDSIAQEINETFTLELVHRAGTNIPTGDGVFFRNTVEVTIIDNDDVQIIFTEDDFRENERNTTGPVSFMPVKISKNSRIANPIVLDIIPLTVMDATNPPGLPNNVPSNNPFSPPFADTNDFDTATIRITFEPDEDEDDNERDAPIPITNDDVNEAIEQVFVVHLILVNSSNPGSIDLTARSTSLCRIIDDDTISIGFEVPSYTYNEPMFEITIDLFFIPPNNSTAYGPVYLFKENGVRTEQIFGIVIQVSDAVPAGVNPATFGQDYLTGGFGSLTTLFPANLQRLIFEVTLFPDQIPEGTEGFLASSSRLDNFADQTGTVFPLPDYLSPRYASTTINILDDDPIIIGFENITYTVDESIGMLEVYVSVISPPEDVQLFASVDIVIQTTAVNATGGVDYRELNAGSFDVFLSFDDLNRRRSFMVEILNDELFENVEVFDLELRFDPFLPPPSGVMLDPGVATVYIQDNDNATIGFINAPYSVGENEGEVDIQVGVIEGSLQREVVVLFSTLDSSAIDGADYTGIQDMLLTFTSSNTMTTITVSIANDDVYELTETFNVTLSFDGDPVPRVTLSPATAVTTIVDDDELVFGFNPTEYSIDEGDGSVSLSISFSGDAGEFVPHVIVSTQDGTAISSGPEADYTAIVAQSVSFSNTDRRDVLVTITSDSFTEFNETFSAILSSAFLATVDGGQAIQLSDQELARLILSPDMANINILDDDEAIIGFDGTAFSAVESDGALNFDVRVLQGMLRINVSVQFETSDGSAHAGDDYDQTTTTLVFFGQSALSVPVGIIDDFLVETSETFLGRLSADGILPPNVRLNPIEATGTIIDDDDIIIGFDPATYTVNEADGTVTLTVKVLNGTISEERTIPVRVTTADGTAQAPSDYAASTIVLTFSSSMPQQSVIVSIENDDLLEIDEVFGATLELVNVQDRDGVMLDPAQASVTILDDDEAVIGFVPSQYSVTEGVNQLANLNVELISGQLGREVLVILNTRSGTAISGQDFGGIIGRQLTFGPSVTSLTIQVNITDDNFLEDLETFFATISSEVPRLTLDPSEAAINITDNDLATFGFDRGQYSVVENETFVAVTIRQISGSTLNRNVLITLVTGDGTAVSSGEIDFEAHSVDLTFGPGNTEQVVNIRIIDDLRLETDERFNSTVFLTVTDPVVSLSPDTAGITIIDDDNVVIGFNQTLYEVSEDAGQATVYVVLVNGILRRPVVVSVSTRDGTALSGSDYSSIGTVELTFDRDNSRFPIPVNILDDEIHELNENFFGELATSDEDVILTPEQTMIRILDNDVVTFTFRQPMYMFMENVGNGTVCVDRNGATDQTITVVVNGAIQSGPFTRSLVFAPDDTSLCIEFTVEDDNIALEDPEEFTWTIDPIPIPRVELGTDTTTVVIVDDDPLILNLVKADDIPEEIGLAEACVTFSNPFARSFEISPNVGRPPNNSVPAVALPMVDYMSNIPTIMARPGDTEVCFDIMIVDDALVEESQECLMVSFTAEQLENLEIGDNSAVCCIVDNDNVTIGFEPASYTVSEEEGTVTLFVRVLDGQLARSVEVTFDTQDGTANSTGPDMDYMAPAVPITLQFLDNLVQEVQITIVNDDITETIENFEGLLSTIDPAVILAPDRANVAITDTDTVVIGFDPTGYEVSEDAGSETLFVRLISGVLEREVTVFFSTSPGTATSADPADYERTTALLTFSPTINVVEVDVNIIDDLIHEDREVFFGVLDDQGQPVITNPETATVTIVDDIDPITIGFERTEYNVTEGGQEMVCAILTSGILEKEVLVTVSSSDITANENSDYTAVSVTLTFNADTSRACFDTFTADDDLLEDDELYGLTLSSDEPGLTLDPQEATVTIINDDDVVIGLTETVFEVTEGDGVLVEVCARVFQGDLERDAVVTLRSIDGSAVSQGIERDYQSLSVQLTFTSSMNEICRNVTINNDVFYEDAESFTVMLTTTDEDVTLTPDTGTVTILDEDGVVIGFVETLYIVLEDDGQQQVCAELRMGTLRTNVEVQFTTANGDAMEPDDYTATSMLFVFSDGQQQQCANVPIMPDNLVEGTENFFGRIATSAERVTLMPDQTQIDIVEDQPLVIGFINAPYTTREESGFVTVTVGIISEGIVLDDDFVVSLETRDLVNENAAEAGRDYTAITVPLTFNSEVKVINLNVTILDDEIVESPEVFSGVLSIVTMGPAAPDASLNPGTALITIEDEEDKIIIGLTETLITVDESVGMRQVCAVVIDGDLERPVLVQLDLFPVTAQPGEDYTMQSYELVFDQNNKGPICNDVEIISDTTYEFEETLTFNLSSNDGAVVLDPSGGVLVIEDDDEVTIGWDQELYEVSESVGQARLCAVVFQGNLDVTLPQLNIGTTDGTASRGGLGVQQDYIPTPTPNQFVFSAANQGRMCTNIPIVDDLVLEQTIEDFFADLSFNIGEEPDRVTILPATTTVEIEDNDPLTIGFLETSYTVSEADDATLRVGILSGSLETPIVVNFTTSDDSANAPNDYISRTNVQITFGPMTQTVSVQIEDDLIDEEDIERFTASLVLDTDNPRVTIDPDMAEVVIADNDLVVIGFEQTTYTTVENDTRVVMVCASIRPGSPELDKTVVVNLTSSDGTATAPEDYNSVTRELIFDGSNSRNCVEFTASEDDVVDPDESFIVTLTGGNDVDLTPDTATVTISDIVDLLVSFVEPQYTFVETDNVGFIGVMKTAVSNVDFQVRVTGGPSTSSPIVQSAASVDTVITFLAGQTAPDVINIPINITDDDVALEAIESYVASLEIIQPAPNVLIGAHPTTSVNVLDEDLITVGFGSEGVTVVESSGEFRMCVVKNRDAVQDITVTISSSDESAVSNEDYTPSGIPTTVTIPASEDRTCFTGPIIDDLIALEPDESFILTIDTISPNNPSILRGIETTRITITDDDIVRVRYEEPEYIFREESGLATVCLIKDLETAVGFSVDSVTTDDLAIDTLDYTGGTFSVDFGTGAGDRQCINIELLRDNLREPREDFFVDLSLDNVGPIRPGIPSRAIVGIEDTGILVNDTVIGDPLMTVPILVRDEDLAMLGADRVSLCYEIHGRSDANFNLVTDQCATVNAHYDDLTSYLNVIDQVGVRAVDDSGVCRNIQVDVDGCTAAVDGVPLAEGGRFSNGGISVRRYSNRVRISVPNCNELSLVMWVICETRTLEDPFGGDNSITGDMIKFVVMRGLNFGHRMAHGLLGQFWNIPVSVEPFTGVDRNGNPVPERYVVNITSSFSDETRSYTGWLYDLTWSFEEGPCLYVGNRQAGPIYEVKDPNDPIIEGRYSEYLVPDLFSEEEYAYGLFEENNCLSGGIPTGTPN